jgi:hypothetical protein
MPVLVDYACAKCDKLIEDEFFATRDAVVETIPCDCGSDAERIFTTSRQNFIHPSHSSMYGKFEEGLGCVVEDYGHKQRLMRDMGVMEGADTVGGSRCHRQSEPERAKNLPQSTWLDRPADVHD